MEFVHTYRGYELRSSGNHSKIRMVDPVQNMGLGWAGSLVIAQNAIDRWIEHGKAEDLS